jgi:hypothetical protein
MKGTNPYFEELARRLREAGVPADRAADLADDLTAYVTESGTAPEDEFGPPAAFAEQLVGTAEAPSTPAETDERWEFHADAFNEMGLLRRFGDQGWEVVSYTLPTGFACRRSLESPQRWEYRREIVPPARAEATITRLAEDGWELAATYMFWHYFKRPVAATTGPAAALNTPPETPDRRLYWSRRFAAYIAAVVAAWVTLVSLAASEPGSRLATVAGAFTGMAIILIPVAFLIFRHRSHRS